MKKRYIIFAACFLLVLASVVVYFTAIRPTFMPKPTHVIVIDAGHGGKDGGAVGSKTDESSLNLEYALSLKKICEEFGFKVVLTRSDMNGLYSPLAKNKKRSEMEKRQQIIQKSNPDIVVSLHMNSFSSPSSRGSHVFYANESEGGESLANFVSTSLHDNIEHAHKTSSVGDYFILNCTQIPSILVECGFLSNPEEEELLLQENYREKFCYYIFCGILKYFS